MAFFEAKVSVNKKTKHVYFDVESIHFKLHNGKI
jgi:hypothetical protein